MEVGLFSHATSGRTSRDIPRLHQGKFRLGIRNFFTEKVVKRCNRLLREVVESPSLKAFKNCADAVLSLMVNLAVLG